MPKPKRYRLCVDFDSIQQMLAFAEGTHKPNGWEVVKHDGLSFVHDKNFCVKRYYIKAYKFTPENVKIVSDDELRKQLIDGTLVDPKLETTLFPNGRPSK